jgi:predicted ATP-dependent Lon-type protease
MARVSANVVLDQSDDLQVSFSRSMHLQTVTVDFMHQTVPVGSITFVSPEYAADRFALWLESAAELVRQEAALLEADEVLNAHTDLIDTPIDQGPF